MPEYPILMVQWPWGVQALWNEEAGVFILPEELPSDFRIAENGPPLMEIRVDGIEPQTDRTELAWGWFWDGSNNRKQIFNQLLANKPSPDLNFWLTDYAIEDMEAAGRAYFTWNTKPHKGLKIAQPCQVENQDGYMKYFDKWKQQGFTGAVCQQYQAQFSDPHCLCDLFLGKLHK